MKPYFVNAAVICPTENIMCRGINGVLASLRHNKL